MSELALQLIREAKEQRLTRLDLGNCGLTTLPEELFELEWLEELILSRQPSLWPTYEDRRSAAKQISSIPIQIRYLVNLKELTISDGMIYPANSGQP